MISRTKLTLCGMTAMKTILLFLATAITACADNVTLAWNPVPGCTYELGTNNVVAVGTSSTQATVTATYPVNFVVRSVSNGLRSEWSSPPVPMPSPNVPPPSNVVVLTNVIWRTNVATLNLTNYWNVTNMVAVTNYVQVVTNYLSLTNWVTLWQTNYVTVTNQPPPVTNTVPTAPSGFTQTAATTTTVTLRWVDNSSNETGFRIEVSTAGASGPFAAYEWTAIPANRTTITDTGLMRGRSYWYRIRAFNAAGASAWSPVLQAKTSP